MGQQQLLLLVLGIVIVGLAVVVGIQAFSENQKKANLDALTLTAMRIASDAQAWGLKPPQFGGPALVSGSRITDFSTIDPSSGDLTFPILGYTPDASDDLRYEDLNGGYVMSSTGADLIIEATSATTSGGGDNNLVCVTVSGFESTDITTELNPSSGSC